MVKEAWFNKEPILPASGEDDKYDKGNRQP